MKSAEQSNYRGVVCVSAVIAVLIAALCVVDLFAAWPYQPFAGHTVFDVTFLLSAFIVLYLCWDTWHDLELGAPQRRSITNRRTTQERTTRTRETSRRSGQRSSRQSVTAP